MPSPTAPAEKASAPDPPHPLEPPDQPSTGDWFACLGLPRLPALTAAEIQDAFRERARATPEEAGLAPLIAARQGLLDPVSRLRLLLDLDFPDAPPLPSPPLPGGSLGPEIQELLTRARTLLAEGPATTALRHALLSAKLPPLRQQLLEKNQNLDRLTREIEGRLSDWHNLPPDERHRLLAGSIHSLTFLRRWKSQIDETTFQLSLLDARI